MAVGEDYLPKARNKGSVKLPAAFSNIGKQNKAEEGEAPKSSLPAAFQNIGNPQPSQEAEDNTGIIPSFKRGAAGTFASLTNLVGADNLSQEALEYASQYPKEVPDIQSIKDLGDLGTFAVESAAENMANMLAILGAGVATFYTGGSFVAGAAGANLLLQAGDSKQTIEAEGGDPNLVNVGIPALANTALDTFSFMKIAKKAGVLSKVTKHLEEAAEVSGIGGRLKKGAEAGAEAFITEGSTEALQTYNNLAASKLANDKDVREAFAANGKDIDEIVNAFAAGSLGSAVTVGPIGAITAKTSGGNEGSRVAPIQETEVDRNPMEGDEPRRAGPKPAPEGQPPVDDTTGYTEESEVKAETQNLDEVEIDSIKAELDEITKDLEAGVDPNVNLSPFDFGGKYTLSPEDQKPGFETHTPREMPEAYRNMEVSGKQGNFTIADISASEEGGTYTADKENFLSEFGDHPLANEVINFAEVLRNKYAPDARLVLGSSKKLLGKNNKNISGAMAHGLVDGKPIFLIGLNPSRLFEVAELTNDTKNYRNVVVETVAHEFGHALTQNGLGKESKATQAAVYKDYNNWLKRAEKMTFRQFIKSRYASTEAAVMLRNTPEQLLKMKTPDALKAAGRDNAKAAYTLNFEEFMADQFARMAAGDKSLSTTTSSKSKSFWTRMYNQFKELYKDLKSSFGVEGNVKKYFRKQELKSALAIREAMPDNTRISPEASEILGDIINEFKPDKITQLDGEPGFLKFTEQLLFNKKDFAAIQKNYRVSTGFTRMFAGRFLTPSQIAERYGIPATRQYMDRVYDFYVTKMKGISRADTVASRWMNLPAAQADALGRFVFDVSEMSDAKGSRLSEKELNDAAIEAGLTKEQLDIYREIDASFGDVLSRLEQGILRDIAREFTDQPEAFIEEYNQAKEPGDKLLVMTRYADPETITDFNKRLVETKKAFAQLRERNYFPRMRFGRYTVLIKEKNAKGNFEATSFEAYESKKERNRIFEEYKKQYQENTDVKVTAGAMDDTARSLYGMPQMVVNRIVSDMENSGDGLSQEQRATLRDISLDLSPGKRYLRHLQKRKNTSGFSTEAMRTYSAYMTNASNHLARVEHTDAMTDALKNLRQAAKDMEGDITDINELESYYTEHFRYLLNPENDWAKLRAFGFLWYLGFNPKSAVVNLTQLPMVSYPFLAARYGDAKSVSSLTKAMRDVTAHYTRKKSYSESEQRLMDRLLEEGVFDESMASNLSGLSEGNALQRVLPTSTSHRIINKINHYGSAFFRPAEKFNRATTALATFRLNMEKTQDFESAYAAAKEATQKSQFEYAKYNRPEFMRGKKSAFFLFYNYTQQFLYLAFNGSGNKAGRKTALRMWAMMFVLAGAQGLPFAEYILSSLDLLGTKFKRWTGMENPMVDTRRDIRELIDDLGLNPDLIMHGTGRYLGAGPLKALEMFGAPVPNLDITGSVSMGEPLPGLRMNELRGNPEQVAGQLLLNGLGPIPNIGLQVWNGVTSNDPDEWKSTEKALPIAFRNVSKATRFATRGMETSRGGAEMLPYDGSDPYHAGEIIAQAMGFTATRLSQKREMYGEQMNTALYWSERRQLLLERYAYAKKTGDSNMMKRTVEDIREFNKVLTNKELKPYRISNANMRRSLNFRLRTLRMREKGLPTTDRDRLIYKDIEDLYE